MEEKENGKSGKEGERKRMQWEEAKTMGVSEKGEFG